MPTKDRAKYKREEEQAQYKSKKSRLEQEIHTHGSGFTPMHYGRKTISDFLDIGCRDVVDAKVFRFIYVMFFTHLIGMK